MRSSLVGILLVLALTATSPGQSDPLAPLEELGHDDGVAESSWVLSNPTGPSDWFNVDFEQDAAGRRIAALYLNPMTFPPGSLIKRLGIYPESAAGAPDLGHPIRELQDLVVPDAVGDRIGYDVPVLTLGSTDVHVAMQLTPGDSAVWLSSDDSSSSGRSYFSSTAYSSGGIPYGSNWMLGMGAVPDVEMGSLLINGSTSDEVAVGGDLCLTWYGGVLNHQFSLWLCQNGVPFAPILPFGMTRTDGPFVGPVPMTWQLCTEATCTFPLDLPLELCTIYPDPFDLKPNGKPKIKFGPSAVVTVVSPGVELDFSQVDYDVDGVAVDDSSWGGLEIRYTGMSDTMYLNVTVNDDWQIQNYPLLSPEGVGAPQRETIGFHLGVADGTEVSSLFCGYEVTEEPDGDPPKSDKEKPVRKRKVKICHGTKNSKMVVDESAPFEGFKIVEGTKILSPPAPNVDLVQQKKWCVTAAVSNALNLLRDRFGINLYADEDDEDGDGDKEDMSELRWLAGIFHQSGNNDAAANAWASIKASDPDLSAVVETIEIGKGVMNSRWNEIVQALACGYAVEMGVTTNHATSDSHVVLVTGMAKIQKSKKHPDHWVILVKHDQEQSASDAELEAAGHSRGTVTEALVLNFGRRRFENGEFFSGKKGKYEITKWVIEKPKGHKK